MHTKEEHAVEVMEAWPQQNEHRDGLRDQLGKGLESANVVVEMDRDNQGRGDQEEQINHQLFGVEIAKNLLILWGHTQMQKGRVENQGGHDKGRVDAQTANPWSGNRVELARDWILDPASFARQSDYAKG